jgi:UDP-glucose 4-epimerase
VEGSVADRRLLDDLFAQHAVRAVLHFAGSIRVDESIGAPLLYYRNNTVASHALIERCVAAGLEALIFSSTAAVYGVPEAAPVGEDAPLRPISPYGWSKLMTERMLVDSGAAHGLRSVILRYFNVAGSDPGGRIGPPAAGARHLIRVACEAALGRRAQVPLFGTDYPTADGTCIRDFIHVSDLADAHLRALEYLLADGPSRILNCGYGHGYSVREVLATVARVSGRTLAIEERPRRPGDAPAVVADARRIRETLEWRPRYDRLEQIVRDALESERRRPDRPLILEHQL